MIYTSSDFTMLNGKSRSVTAQQTVLFLLWRDFDLTHPLKVIKERNALSVKGTRLGKRREGVSLWTFVSALNTCAGSESQLAQVLRARPNYESLGICLTRIDNAISLMADQTGKDFTDE